MPSTAQIASHLAAPLLRPLRALATLPDWLPKMHASASLRLTLVAADHLLASDAALPGFRRGKVKLGSSDPYVVVAMGGDDAARAPIQQACAHPNPNPDPNPNQACADGETEARVPARVRSSTQHDTTSPRWRGAQPEP